MMSMINGGTTVLYVSHSLQSIRELCTKVVWLEHGKVVKIGDTKKVCDAYFVGDFISTFLPGSFGNHSSIAFLSSSSSLTILLV